MQEMAPSNNNPLKIKICGMQKEENIKEIRILQPDYMGFIFYKPSPRYIQPRDAQNLMSLIPETIKKIGVFVNEPMEKVLEIINLVGLDGVQLHGKESPDYCEQLQDEGRLIIKAFSVGTHFNFEELIPYKQKCDYFLFDTQTPNYGGSGTKFNWDLLHSYTLKHPFFLSGGISENDADSLKEINHPQLIGLDVNSRFEIEPGIKNKVYLQKFIEKIRS